MTLIITPLDFAASAEQDPGIDKENCMSTTILAADIGGTSSRFAMFKVDQQNHLHLLERQWLPTAAAGSFRELLDQLDASKFPVSIENADAAAFAVAGPVDQGVFSAPPNIPWTIDLRSLGAPLRRTRLLNDFMAQAYACSSPAAELALTVLPGTAAAGGTIAVLGAGTGLGKSFLLSGAGGRLIAGASEGGHATFPAEELREFEFMRFVADRMRAPFASWDDIVSGRGLSFIHEFLTGQSLLPEQIASVVSPDSETFGWFSTFYGRVCRTFALEVLALGGLYIAGGIAAKNPFILTNGVFEESFRRTGALSDLINRIPVRLISDEESGLWGAALFGKQLLQLPEE